MLLLQTLFLFTATLLTAQEFAFDPEYLARAYNHGNPGGRKELNHVQANAERPQNLEIHHTTIHKFPMNSFRSFKITGAGRFKTFKQTTGDIRQSREELVYLAPQSEEATSSTSTSTDNEIEIQIIIEDDGNILETIVENVRAAYEDYVSPILNGQVTTATIQEAARNALDWISQRIWGTKAHAKLSSRVAVVKLHTDTGEAMIVKSDDVNIQVIRIDQIVYDAASQALGSVNQEATGNALSVGVFSFEVGDLILISENSFFEELPRETLMKALSHEHRSVANKADALVKAAPKGTSEKSFLLSVFD